MKEFDKENDIFVSTLLNPTASTEDLLANGINGSNTGLLDQDTYKNSKFVKQAFDENGVFNNEAFTQAYNYAQQKYSDLTAVQSYEDLNSIVKYNENDIYAPLNSNKVDKNYSIEKVRNPLHTSTGVTSLFGKGESDKSARELAQSHKIWDPKNEKWLDETPEDLGLKYLYKPSLVYATWDEDGTHFDESLGREVKHTKGEWKTDENGEYYTELAGNKQQYGKEFVALSNILTKEDSWANKIDFFDSDDKHKSIGGQLMKTAATVVPYLIPGVNLAWGGITAAIGMGTVLPTFAKMLEGIVIGDKETDFTKAMSAQENWFNKFSSSHSDEAQKSIINSETILETVGDVFGQLYQMRAAASLSKLFTHSMSKAEKEASQKFAQKFGAEFAKASQSKGFTDNIDQWKSLYSELLQATPEMKAIVDKQTKLSKSLSLGYMALTSSADVYSDALQGGYDRRMAGFAGITATVGQYLLMMNNRMGDWFLDATVGYKEGVSRNAMRQALKPYYDQIASTSAKLGTTATADEKMGMIAKLYNNIFKQGGKKLVDLIKYGGESIWQRATIEGVEEITEEAVMDATKGMYDFLSYMGVGKNAKTASFGGWNNTFSSEGAQRYLMNFIGGALGGALFDVQAKHIEPKINALISGKALPEVRYSIIDEVMKGHTQDLLEEASRLAMSNKTPINLNGQILAKTQGEVIRDTLQNYIKFVDGVITENNFKIDNIMSDDMIKKVIRTKALQPVVESSGIMDMITEDYAKMVDDYVKLQADYDSKYKVNEDDKDKKKVEEKVEDKKENKEKDETPQGNSEKEKLEKQLADKKKEIVDFLSGKNESDYLRTALIYLHPQLRQAAFGVDKYIFTKGKYGVDYSTLQETGAGLSKASIDAEYKEWKNSNDTLEKFREIGVKGFDEAEMGFSKILKEYADSAYGDTRNTAIDEVLAESNFLLASLMNDQASRDSLLELSRQLSDAKLPGINLEDKLRIGNEAKVNLVNELVNVNTPFLEEISNLLNEELRQQAQTLTPEEQAQIVYYDVNKLKEVFESDLLSNLEQVPIENFTKQMMDNFLLSASTNMASIIVGNVKKSLPGDYDANILKISIDNKLQALGFNPIQDYVFDGDILRAATKYVATIIAPKFSENLDTNFNVGNSVLEAYVDKNEILDNEIVRKINQAFYNDAINRHQQIWKAVSPIFDSAMDEMFDEHWEELAELQKTNLSKFQKALREGIDQNLDLNEIIENWLFGENGIINPEWTEFKTLEKNNPDYKQKAIAAAINIIRTLNSYTVYEKVKTKSQKNNPLYKALREIGMKVFDGEELKLFDFLASESKALSQVSDIGEYIRQGFTKEAIDNFITKLEFIQALALGMEQTDIDPEHQIAYNVQMKLWDTKWNDGKNADKYVTINTSQVISIQQDLNLLINKLQFIKKLIESNVESKQKENLKTEAKFQDLLLNKISDLSQITVGGVTVLPEDKELERAETNAEKLAIVEHTLFSKVKELVANGQKLEAVIDELYSKFGINRETIHNTNLRAAQLNSDTKALSEYDFFVWLTTILGSDSHEFLYKYKDLLSQESYKLVPFFTQEYAVKVLYSFANDKNGVHDAAIKWLYQEQTPASVQELSRIAFVNGIAGAGKTAAVMSIVKAMLNEYNIICAAPNQNQATKLSQSLTSVSDSETAPKVFSKRELLEQFITKEGLEVLDTAIQDQNLEGETKLISYEDVNDSSQKVVAHIDPKYIQTIKGAPKFIFIDEVTHFNIAELAMLDAAAKKNGFKIICAGDTLQKGNNLWHNNNIQDVFTWKTPTLTISSRAANIHQKDNVTLLQTVLRQIETISEEQGINESNPQVQTLLSMGKKLSYYQSDKELQGAKIVKEITVDDLKSIKAAAQGKQLMIIADLDNNNEINDSNFISKLHDAGITDYVVYSPDDYSAKAVQGAEADYVIVKNMPTLGSSKISNLITFYTYLSRALEGTLILDNSKYAENLNLLSELATYTSRYELPGLTQQAKIKGEKIEQIAKLLGNYEPPKVEEKKTTTTTKPTKTTTTSTSAKTSTSEEEIDSEDAEQLLTNTEEAENNMQHSALSVNVISEKSTIDGIRGYSYYNRLGLGKDSATTNNGSHLDLDGLLGKTGQRVPKNIKAGYKKLKNFLVTSNFESLYNSDGSMSSDFIAALYGNDILDLLYTLYPNIADDLTEIEDIRNKIKDAIDAGELQLNLGEKWYITVKKYDEITDASDSLAASSLSAKSGALIANFGKQLEITHNGETIVNQMITFGSLSQMDTIVNANAKFSKKIKCDGYAKLLADASQQLKTKKLVTYEVAEPQMGRDLVIYNGSHEDSFISIKDMIELQGISFDANEEDIPNVYLINNERSTVNGVESYSFLHLIAQTEPSSLDYKNRIEQLEKAFVNGDRLTVTGYYFTLGSYGPMQRVLIMQPSSYSFKEALEWQHRILHSKTVQEGSRLVSQAEAMSQASQMRLFRAVFKDLGAVDANGLVVSGTEGIKPYIEKIIGDLSQSKASDKTKHLLTDLSVWLSSEIEQWGDKDFDIDFLSHLLRGGTPDENGKVSNYGRYVGPLLINDLIQINNNGTITAKQLLEEGQKRRTSVDIDFDLTQNSYREFQASAETHNPFELGGEATYNPVKIKLTADNMHFIGLYNTYLQPPYFYFNDDVLGQAESVILDFTTTEWERPDVSWEQAKEKKPQTSSKTPTTASMQEMRAANTYNSKTDRNPIQVIFPSKRGNLQDKDGNTYRINSKFYNVRTFTPEELKNWKNEDYHLSATKGQLFDIRLYDTVQIFGDDTHTYKLSYAIINDSGYIVGYKFSHKDGKEITSSDIIKPSEISAVVQRDIPTEEYGWKYITYGIKGLGKDYYSTEEYEYRRQDYRKRQSGKAALIWKSDEATTAIEHVFNEKNVQHLLIYAVHDSDESVISPVVDAAESLEYGVDLTSTDIHLCNSIEEANNVISILSEEENLNGIAIIGVYGSGEGYVQFMQNRKAFLEKIANNGEGYIKAYISNSKKPKFTQKTAKAEAKEKAKAKKNDAEILQTNIDQVEKAIADKSNFNKMMDDLHEIQYTTFEDAKKHFPKNTVIYRYLNADNKVVYSVFPKQILNDPKVQYNESPLQVGDTIWITQESDGTYYSGEITAIGDNVTFNYELNGQQTTRTVSKQQFGLLYGIKYAKPEYFQNLMEMEKTQEKVNPAKLQPKPSQVRRKTNVSNKVQEINALLDEASKLNDYYEYLNKVKEKYYNSFDEAKNDFPSNYIIFPHTVNEEVKYSVFPKSIITDYKNVQFNGNWNVGDSFKILYQTADKNGEFYSAIITNITSDQVEFDYVINNNVKSKQMNLNEFNMLTDVLYYKEKATQPKPAEPKQKQKLKYLPEEVINELRSKGIEDSTLKIYDNIYQEMTTCWDNLGQSYEDLTSEDIIYYINEIRERQQADNSLQIEDMFVIDENGDIDLITCK